MEQKTVTHESGGKTLTVTVSEATSLMGMRHTMMVSDAINYIQDKRQQLDKGQSLRDIMPEEELSLYMLRRFAWPDCIACAISSEGFDLHSLTFDEFCLLPEIFVARWQRTARKLNPHWVEEEQDDDADAKNGESAPESKLPE